MDTSKTSNTVFTNHVAEEIDATVSSLSPSGVFVLVDRNTEDTVLPRMQMLSKAIASATPISIAPGDDNKTVDALTHVWKQLSDNHATRSSVLINLGGGMVTDLGSFAASTFKRGIPFINVPTTLLAAVDASVGGKTGINFNGLKNEVGTFSDARKVIISTMFFNTLSMTQLRSGYAEMLKHGLIDSGQTFNTLLAYHVEQQDTDRLLTLLKDSVAVKQAIVDQDPREAGLRRALNLGHTVAHAFESVAIERKSPIPHGYAVAYGLVVAAVLSHMKLDFPSTELHKLSDYVRSNYGAFTITCDEYPHLLDIMSHDKKNLNPDTFNFTLLRAPGDVATDTLVTPAEITAALDIYRDLLGLA
ncbi:MAG: 3-dehydroquinate synthase [Muribaculaceae bacterium]|nr:3-dehydroquinate synthase [Muribaculaceae bacterium]